MAVTPRSRAPLGVGAMLGSFAGFWTTLVRLDRTEVLDVVAPAGIVAAVLAILAVSVPAGARPFVLGGLGGVVVGASVALLIGYGLLTTSS